MSEQLNPTWSDVMKFELMANPIIFDVGGYKGEWAQIAMDTYPNATVYIFEPVKSFYDAIVGRYKDNGSVKVFNFGLSDENRIETISLIDDSSSVFRGDGAEEVVLKDIREFLFENDIFHVDLIKINIEGEEYRLMEYLTKNPELNIFKNYLIQFHKFMKNHEERRDGIVQSLEEYYNRIFNYEFVFEGWSQKNIQKIACIGDSHISIFSNSPNLISEGSYNYYRNFSSYRAGPYLAYNLVEKQDAFNLCNSITKTDNLLLCFGEIDCRAQVKKQVESRGVDFKQIIDEIVEKYFHFIDGLGNGNIILFSITPDLKENPFFEYYNANKDLFDCPTGSYKERREYKNYFNTKVEEEAKKRNYKYASIYDFLVNDESTKEIYFLDDIHLKPKNVMYLVERSLIKVGLAL